MKNKFLKFIVLLLACIMSLSVFACGGDPNGNGSGNEIEYIVQFNSNGGQSVKHKKVDKGDLVERPSNPIRPGYNFLGWYYNGTLFDFETKITGDITLTAMWREQTSTPGGSGSENTYTVTFDSNGGSSVPSQTGLMEGAKATKPADPVRSNYDFVCWLLNGSEYNFNTSITSDITLTAKWEVKSVTATFTVSFDVNGGMPNPSAQIVADGGYAYEPIAPTKSGHTFLGWYLDGESTKFSFITTQITSNITLTAKWEEATTVNPGTGDSDVETGGSIVTLGTTGIDDYNYGDRLYLGGQDDVGRTVLPAYDYNSVGMEIKIGLFYSLWHGGDSNYEDASTRDIQKMLDSGKSASEICSTSSGNINKFYYAGEPLYGYYHSKDPWVIMRHMELMYLAGVDYLCIDATNAILYDEATLTLFDTLLILTKAGFNVPKICFYTNTDSGNTVKSIKDKFYFGSSVLDSNGNPIYQSIFYYDHNDSSKPVIIGTTSANVGSDIRANPNIARSYIDVVDPTLSNYFNIYESQWPNMENSGYVDGNGVPWTTWKYPQRLFNTGYMAIPVAQHDHNNTSVSYMGPGSSKGYNNATGGTDSSQAPSGLSFQQMFDTVYGYRTNSTLKSAIVCSFNEWTAMKQPGGYFVDVFNLEYSRDLEMTRDSRYGDNFYMQLMYNIRRIKYQDSSIATNPNPEYNEVAETTITNLFESADYKNTWGKISAVYSDFTGDAIEHDHVIADYNTSIKNEVGANYTERNDIRYIRVAHNATNLYVYIECVDEISAYNTGDVNWMNVLIGTEYGDSTMGGYNYFINRTPNGDGTTSIHKYSNGTFTSVGTARYKVDANVMVLEIPLSAIGGSSSVRFKVADNVQDVTDIMEYYISGDCAPLGRIGYTYNLY